MKTNQKTHHCWAPADRLLSAAIAMLLAPGFSASAAGNVDARAAKPPTEQATKKAIANPNGAVVGTLTINDKVIKLKYIYVRHEAPPPDGARLRSNGEKPKGAIEVIITNQPLPEDIVTKIQESKYEGSDKIRGIVLIIDPSGEADLITRFLLQSGTVSPSGLLVRRGNPKIENGMVRGKIECRSVHVDEITYSVSFDAPLKN